MTAPRFHTLARATLVDRFRSGSGLCYGPSMRGGGWAALVIVCSLSGTTPAQVVQVPVGGGVPITGVAGTQIHGIDIINDPTITTPTLNLPNTNIPNVNV